MLKNTFSLASTRKDETLYCRISGRIDSSNSSEFLQGLMDYKNNISHKNLELDLKELEYISSSGLRGLLTLQKEEPNKVRLTNVSEGIYRTLEITGFTRIFDTHRIPREFDVTPYKEITRGSTGVIYRIDEDTILKLYPPGKDISFAEDEKRLAQIA
ncbi:MAG: STAS domain-containing protein, partial [Bacteroidaceae bacterium]|nr:STAS domain-containing protein [Bacteroidaceae bacterium]